MKNKIISLALVVVIGIPLSLYAVEQQGINSSVQANYQMKTEEVSISTINYSNTAEADEIDAAFCIMRQKRAEAAIEQIKELQATVPDDIRELTEYIGAQYQISPELLQAIIFYESSYKPNATNGSCKGYMQINMSDAGRREDVLMLAHGTGLNAEAAVYDPQINIEAGALLLKELFDEYEDVGEVLIRYNGDRTGLKRYKEYGFLSSYAEKVLELSELLERSIGK